MFSFLITILAITTKVSVYINMSHVLHPTSSNLASGIFSSFLVGTCLGGLVQFCSIWFHLPFPFLLFQVSWSFFIGVDTKNTPCFSVLPPSRLRKSLLEPTDQVLTCSVELSDPQCALIFWPSADAALQVRSDTVSAKNSLCINLHKEPHV